MKTIQEELELLCRKFRVDDSTKLKAEDVVAFARDPSTALHKRFHWEDTEAADNWRLHQARQLLRVWVVVLPNQNKPFRAFVSLTTDRKTEGGGYRQTVEVLSNEEFRQQMLADALAEMNAFRRKYAMLQELVGVFKAIDAIPVPAAGKGAKTPKRAKATAMA